jgi:hypothetical protein
MQTSMKDIFKRLYVYIVLSVIALYVIASNIIKFPPSLLEAITFMLIFSIGVWMYKQYPKYQNQYGIVTPKDRQTLELTLYVYMGAFIFQALLNNTVLSGLKVIAGCVLLGVSMYGIVILLNIMKK